MVTVDNQSFEEMSYNQISPSLYKRMLIPDN